MLTDCRNCCEEGLYCIPFLICCMCTVMVTMPDEYITITIITCICTHAWRDSVQLDAVCVVSQSSRYAMVTTVSIVIVACIWIRCKLYGLLWCQANKALWSRVLIISSITIVHLGNYGPVSYALMNIRCRSWGDLVICVCELDLLQRNFN